MEIPPVAEPSHAEPRQRSSVLSLGLGGILIEIPAPSPRPAPPNLPLFFHKRKDVECVLIYDSVRSSLSDRVCLTRRNPSKPWLSSVNVGQCLHVHHANFVPRHCCVSENGQTEFN